MGVACARRSVAIFDPRVCPQSNPAPLKMLFFDNQGKKKKKPSLLLSLRKTIRFGGLLIEVPLAGSERKRRVASCRSSRLSLHMIHPVIYFSSARVALWPAQSSKTAAPSQIDVRDLRRPPDATPTTYPLITAVCYLCGGLIPPYGASRLFTLARYSTPAFLSSALLLNDRRPPVGKGSVRCCITVQNLHCHTVVHGCAP